MKQMVIVGGSGGLGQALVTALLDHNCEVTVAGRTKAADERARFYAIDALTADWRSLYQSIEADTRTPIDAVIFVAGSAVFGKTALIPAGRARQTFELNFWACGAAAKAAAEYWSGHDRAGTFLAILSIVARHAVPLEAYYSASKAAMARFLESLQFEYASQNIRLLSAFPGMLKTPFRRQSGWYGIAPAATDEGADVGKTAHAILGLLEGKRRARVIGWRERSIDLADHLLPGLYDRLVLRARAKKQISHEATRLSPGSKEPV
jgi:short-subunit dehydrogenase